MTYLHTLTLKNCVGERSSFTLDQGPNSAAVANLAITLQNSLFSRCSFNFAHAGSFYGAWNLYDNLFDNCGMSLTEIGTSPNGSTLTTLGYNGFISTTAIGSTGNQTGLNRDFQSPTGGLGGYYYPSSGTSPSLVALLNADSNRTVSSLGLYHFTTRSDLAKEAATVLDIGFHYVATDSSGNPIDTDGDGIPDYVEDANGNNTIDTGETDPATSNGVGSGASALMVFTPLN